MRYALIWHYRGTNHYLYSDSRLTMDETFDALTSVGYEPTLWQGTTKLRG